MYLTDTGVVTPLGVQPYKTLLAGKLYNRSEKLERFWLEELRLALLRRALAYLRGEISRRYRIPKLAGMAPGS